LFSAHLGEFDDEAVEFVCIFVDDVGFDGFVLFVDDEDGDSMAIAGDVFYIGVVHEDIDASVPGEFTDDVVKNDVFLCFF